MTDHYAVFGHPIAHSQSPRIQQAFARATAQDLTYQAMDGGADEATFLRRLRTFIGVGARGANVTLPFKLAALQAADEADAAAQAAGAANTLKFEGDRILARNTDGSGLVHDIQSNLGVALAGRRVLLLGAGGAARGVLLPIAQAGATRIVVANRTAAKAMELAARMAERAPAVVIEGAGLDALDAGGRFDVVINATSASLDGHALGLPPRVFNSCALAYDLVYGRGLTPFLGAAQSGGAARLADGIGMLVEQAAEAFAWWRGVRPDTAALRAQLAQPLA